MGHPGLSDLQGRQLLRGMSERRPAGDCGQDGKAPAESPFEVSTHKAQFEGMADIDVCTEIHTTKF